MDRERNEVFTEQLQCFGMLTDRESFFRASQIKADNISGSIPRIIDDEARDLRRPIVISHRAQNEPRNDRVVLRRGTLFAGTNTGDRGVDNMLKIEPLLLVLFRRETEFRIHDAIAGKVFDGFTGHALDGLSRLHHGGGAGE